MVEVPHYRLNSELSRVNRFCDLISSCLCSIKAVEEEKKKYHQGLKFHMDLFSNYELGDLKLSNRMVMAPMTRCRAVEGNIPNPLAVTYYIQRSQAGLIITEGSQISTQGVGYIRTPGIYSPEQVAGWQKITKAVHEAGSKIFLQL
jgi:hypothetical protein